MESLNIVLDPPSVGPFELGSDLSDVVKSLLGVLKKRFPLLRVLTDAQVSKNNVIICLLIT